MILAHQRLRPKAASCVNQNPAKCVLAHKIESASDRRNCIFLVEYAGCWFIVTPVKKTSPYAEENQQNTVRRTDHTVSYWAECDCDR
jgi:hypothetical protein